jgi:putative membrane protein
MENNKVLFTAAFNPIFRTYILLYVAFFMLVSIVGIPLLVIWFLGVGQWYSKHYFAKLECELTERNLRFKKGLLFQVEKTIPLENIQDLTFVEGPLLRALHLTIIRVETAGQAMHQGNQMSLVGIVDAPYFRKEVLEQRQRIIQSRSGAQQKDSMAELTQSVKNIEQLLQQHIAKK